MSIQPVSPHRWIVLLMVVGIGFFGMGWIWLSLPVYLPRMAQQFSLSPAQSQFIFGSISISLLFCFVVGGFLGDQLSLKWMVALGSAVMGGSALLRAVAVNYSLTIVASLLTGLGLGLLSPNLVKVLRLWFPPRELAAANALRFAGQRGGAALAQGFVASFLIQLLGHWRLSQAVLGICSVVMAGVWFVAYENPPSLTSSAPAPARPRFSGGQIVSLGRELWGLSRELFTHRDIVLLTCVMFLHLFTFLAFLGLLPTWLEGVSFLDPAWVEFFRSFVFWAALAGTLMFPPVSDWLGRRKEVLMGVMGLLSLGIILIGLAPTQGLLFSSIVVAGLGGGAILPLLLTVVSEHPDVGEDRAGTAPGLVLSVGQIGGIIGPSLGGWALQTSGIAISAAVVGLPLLLGVSLIALVAETGRSASPG